MKTSSFMEEIRKEKEIHRKKATDNRFILFKVLSELGVDRVEATFDGNGDSGQFEPPTFYKSKGKKEVEVKLTREKLDSVIDGISINNGWTFEGGKAKELIRTGGLREAIEDVFYRILESEHSGWEINEGSFGTFSWTLDNDQIELTYNERIEEVNTSEETY